MNKRTGIAGGLLILIISMAAGATEQGRAIVNSAIRSQPEPQAEVVAPLRQGESVTIDIRSGQWIKVTTAGRVSGWVDMLDVRLQSSGWRKKASGFFRWLGSSVGSSGAATTETITVGIRGISAEDLQHAQPNFAALTELDSYQATPQVAQQHAREQQLVARQVAPL